MTEIPSADPQKSVLDGIAVATPCPADWNAMTGDERVRFCGQCQLNVYNLSRMTRQEAETLIQTKEGRLCVRYFQREDGTIIMQDCPVGLQALHRRKATRVPARIAAAAVAIVTVMGVFTATAEESESKTMKQCPKGTVSTPKKCPLGFKKNQSKTLMGKPAVPRHTMGEMMMGDVAVPPNSGGKPETKPSKGSNSEAPVQGRVAQPQVMGQMMPPKQSDDAHKK